LVTSRLNWENIARKEKILFRLYIKIEMRDRQRQGGVYVFPIKIYGKDLLLATVLACRLTAVS